MSGAGARWALGLALPVPLLAAARSLYRLVVQGRLIVDTGTGRRIRPLGPLTVEIDAPRETVFDIVAAPYLGRMPRGMAEHIEVVERGSDMVLAAHHTPVGSDLVATTVETVRFERPTTVTFRLVRGPVPHVVETFAFAESDGGTVLTYDGELGTDLWGLGARWGELVGRRWEAAVSATFDDVKERAERKEAARRRRG